MLRQISNLVHTGRLPVGEPHLLAGLRQGQQIRAGERGKLPAASKIVADAKAEIQSDLDAQLAKADEQIMAKTAESEKDELAGKLKIDLGEIDRMEALLPKAVDRFKELVDDLENTLQRQICRARTQIKALLGDEAIRLVPTTSGGLIAELKGNYAGILELTKNPGPKRTGVQLNLVAGARFETYLISVPLVKKAA